LFNVDVTALHIPHLDLVIRSDKNKSDAKKNKSKDKREAFIENPNVVFHNKTMNFNNIPARNIQYPQMRGERK